MKFIRNFMITGSVTSTSTTSSQTSSTSRELEPAARGICCRTVYCIIRVICSVWKCFVKILHFIGYLLTCCNCCSTRSSIPPLPQKSRSELPPNLTTTTTTTAGITYSSNKASPRHSPPPPSLIQQIPFVR